MTEKEKMLAGRLYTAMQGELRADFQRARRLTRLYNATTEEQSDERQTLIRDLFGRTGSSFYIEPPFRCDYGYNIEIGDHFYANFDCIILDVNKVTVGHHVFLGPRVCIYTAGHPLDPAIRNEGLEFGRPVTIGDNVWIGGNTVINPGVSIGNNVTIGAGSVVTKDIPDNTIAMGVPCRVFRPLDENDAAYWQRLKHDAQA